MTSMPVFLATLILSISAAKRHGEQKLSDQEHHLDGEEHNVKFDHEAFLGKEQAETFSDLPPEEAKRRLM